MLIFIAIIHHSYILKVYLRSIAMHVSVHKISLLEGSHVRLRVVTNFEIPVRYTRTCARVKMGSRGDVPRREAPKIRDYRQARDFDLSRLSDFGVNFLSSFKPIKHSQQNSVSWSTAGDKWNTLNWACLRDYVGLLKSPVVMISAVFAVAMFCALRWF